MTDGKPTSSAVSFKLSQNSFTDLDNFSFKGSLKISGTLNKKYLVKVSCGRAHVIFLTHAGMVFSLGEGEKGQLGHGNTNELKEPMMITSLLNYRIGDISVGSDHNIAIGSLRDLTKKGSATINSDTSKNKEHNLIFSWGNNLKGQIGHGSEYNFLTTPKIVEEFLDKKVSIKKVQSGLDYSLILLENGKLYGLGTNEYKQIYNSQIKINQDENVKESYIYKPFRIKHKSLNPTQTKQKYSFTNIKCASHSSLLITDNNYLFINGKINLKRAKVDDKLSDTEITIENKIFKVKEEMALKISNPDYHFIFNDEALIILDDRNKKVNEYFQEVTQYADSLSISIKLSSPEDIKVKKFTENFRLSLIENNNNNFSTNSFVADDISLFQEYDLSKEFFSENASTNELFQNNISFEQSIEELRNYITLVGISYVGDTGNTSMSFRPKNLPKKTAKEEEYHRKLVEENRRRYMIYLKEKQLEEKRQKEKKEKKKLKLKKLQEIWEFEIIPNWFKKKNDYKYLKKYFYEGIPTNLRGRIWLRCIGNNFSINTEYYEIEVKKAIQILMQFQTQQDNFNDNSSTPTETPNKYNINIIDKEKSIKYIELDIERTFPQLGIFKADSPLGEDLREILRAFVASRPDIGYVQGLSYIAGILLIYMDKYQAFVALVNITLSHNIIPFYRFDEYQIRKRLQIFKQIFYCNLPDLCDYFESLDILPEHYLIEWNMTLFSKNLNIDISARVWDIYMIEGIKAIYEAAIVILSHFEQKFIEMDFEFILQTLKNTNNLNFDEDQFADLMKHVKFPDWVNQEIQKLNDEFIPIY